MKVLIINGSPRANGNTHQALTEAEKALNTANIQTELVCIGKQPIQGCIACGMCGRIGKCTFNDDLYYKIWRTVKDGIDGLIIGSPVYYGGPNGSLCALLDRVFYSLGRELEYLPAAAVAVCRRSGADSTLERIHRYFSTMKMPIVTSQNNNIVYGHTLGQASLDEEGMQTMRTLGQNMAWIVKRLDAKEQGHPAAERPIYSTIKFG